MEREIQYAARFPKSLDPDDPDQGNEWDTRKRDTRGEAEHVVRYVNGRAKNHGFPERAYVVEREVLVGEWVPVGASEAQRLRGGIEE